MITLVLQSNLEVTGPIRFYPALMNEIFTATNISYKYLLKKKLCHWYILCWKDRISSEWHLSPHNTVVILRNNGTCLRPLSKCYVNNDRVTSFVLEKTLSRLIQCNFNETVGPYNAKRVCNSKSESIVQFCISITIPLLKRNFQFSLPTHSDFSNSFDHWNF